MLGIEGNQIELSAPAKSVGRVKSAKSAGVKTVVKLELWLTWGMNAGVLNGSLATSVVGSQWGSPSPLKVTPGVLECSGAPKGLMLLVCHGTSSLSRAEPLRPGAAWPHGAPRMDGQTAAELQSPAGSEPPGCAGTGSPGPGVGVPAATRGWGGGTRRECAGSGRSQRVHPLCCYIP